MRPLRLLNPVLFAAGLCVLIVSASPACGGSDYVWWEGEDFATSTFPKNNPFSPASLGANAQLLSGGNWLNANGKTGIQPPTASWKIVVPADGDYAFWVRKFWKHGPFKWRFDSMPAGEWRECGPDAALADDTQLKKFVNANWVSLGSVQLPKGARTFQVELILGNGKDWGAGFDCFVLSKGPFTPNGKTRPGVKTGKADDGYFAFEPDSDTFRPDALLDLRFLNEPVAGQNGFLSRHGKDITLGKQPGGDTKPARFWAVNVGLSNATQDRASVDYLARRLAKLGVNMVRFHSPLWSDADPTQIDPKKLDALQYFVAAMKKQGIYTTLSFYFPVWADGQKLGLEGFDGVADKKPFALLYFNPKLQSIHRGWLRQMLTSPNPHAAGTPLGQEPAIGMVEIINEDSLFFWTFSKKSVPAFQWAQLEAIYAQWLTKKYGSTAAAMQAWNGERAPGDAADRPALYEAYHMTAAGVNQGGSGKRKRVGDQVQFLAELQRGFYDTATKYIKNDLKYGGLVVASNWGVADPAMLNATERWTYTAGDVMDSHGYFEADHKGDGSAYSVRVGHTFKDIAPVTVPSLLPLRFQQVADYPQIISEIGFTQPNRYRADAVFLSSAYGALQGVDGMFFFAVGSNYLLDASIQKFQVASPAFVQSFPAAALAYRRGDVTEADPAIHQAVPLPDLWGMKGGFGWSQDALDQFRAKDVPPGAAIAGQVDKIDSLTSYIGPIVRTYGPDASQSAQRDLPRYLNRDAKTIASLTGQLRWDYGKGLAVMDTPCAQGAAGFLAAAGTIATSNVRVAMANDYGTATVVSLDGLPIAQSRKVLVQVMTQDQPTGFRAEGGVVKDLGAAPFGIRKVAGSIELLSAGSGAAAKVTAVDSNGYATAAKVATKPTAGGVRIDLLPDVLYYVITRP
ncbi:hypothetical protein [Humisphaera borealis]|uniref:Glycoside hydrolase family 42 N-terminal domain-containing protein n=1 Tax=Humisphaera borealis TaxID=2807512 RepID=A0A7M2X313_9BACT|nr:hypothetical protein [Humisphaera borealis]QOV92167.1 hypothetical protein IPV69_12755 [Humisphaera borealis]